jgi:hypothetical protein
VNLTIVEYCGRLTEDVIDVTFDITIPIILPPVLCVERVLPAEEAAVFENCAISLDENRYRL